MSESSFDRNSIELLAEEFVARYRKGERPPLSEYTQRYPALAAEIVDLFPAMLLMENLKPADDSMDAEQGQRADRNANPPFTQLGDYRIIREVGRGGMGVVYEAEQVSLGRHVALKVLPTEMHANAKHRLRFEREARAAAKLHHTNIVPVFGVGFEEQQCYYVMQFIQGQALDKILEELHRMNVQPGAAAGGVLSGSVKPGPSQLIATGSVATDGPVDSRSAAGAFAHMLLTGVFHESDIESAEGPIDGGTDSFAATIVPEMSQKRLKDQRHDEKPPVRPQSVVQDPADGRQEQSRSAASGRHSTLTAKSSDSLRLSNSSISLSGRSGEKSTKTTKQPTYWESVARIGLQVAGALEYAHSQGVLHRDIKPANLVLDMKGTVWVTDFGLARLQDERDLTRTGDILGTLRYMAPEVFKGQNDARSELYALGLTLYELLALRPAFDGHSRNVLIDQVMHAEIEPLGRINPEIPPDLQTVIHKAISRDPQDRYQSAGELADDLQRFLDDEPIRARRVSTIERMKRWSRHNRGLSTALATVAVLLLVINVVGPLLTWRMARLNSELRQSEGRLNVTVVKLTSTAEELTKARNEAVRQAEQAEIAKLESVTMLADMQTERGFLAHRDGDPAMAALWFANAALQTPGDMNRTTANQLRARNWLNEAPVPAALIKLPGGNLRRLAFQPNGSLMLTLNDSSLRVWNWRFAEVIPWSREITDVTDATWSPDGIHLAVAFSGGDVRVLESDSGRVSQRLGPSEPVAILQWSPDGRRLAVGGVRVQIWNVTADPVRESDWLHPEKVYGLTFNRAGTRLATVCEDDQVRLYAVDDAALPAPLFTPIEHVPERRRSAAVPVFCDGDRKLVTFLKTRQPGWWDTTTGQSVSPVWVPHKYDCNRSLACSPDGKWVVAGSYYSCLLWNVDGSSRVLAHLNQSEDAIFCPDGQSILSACWDGTARIWPLTDFVALEKFGPDAYKKPVPIPQLASVPQGIAYSSDGAYAAIAASGRAVIWEIARPSHVIGTLHGWRNPLSAVRPSFDGKLATIGVWHSSPYKTSFGKQLSVALFENGDPAGAPISVDGEIIDSCLCSDNRLVAVALAEGQSGRLAIYEVATGVATIPAVTLPARPLSLAARPNDPQVAILCADGQIQVIDTQNGSLRMDLPHDEWMAPVDPFPRVAYSPDGATLVTLTSSSRVFVRDAQSGELRFPPLQPVVEGGPCRAIAFSADNRWLATAVNGRNLVQVWNLMTGEKTGPGLPHPGDFYGIFAVAFSPTGDRILTGHKDGQLRLWDWRSGQLLGMPMRQEGEVYDVKFSADGRYGLAAAGSGLYCWDLATSRLIAVLPTNSGPHTMTISGSRIAAAASNFPIIDLAAFISKPESDSDFLRLLSELATNQRLQNGEPFPLRDVEWDAGWDRLVATRQTPEQLAESLAQAWDEAGDTPAKSLVIARATHRGVLERLHAPRPNSLELSLALALEWSRQGRHRDFERLRGDVLSQLREIAAKGPVDPNLMRSISQMLTEDSPRGTWTPLVPTSMKGGTETTFTRQPNGFILAGIGNGQPDTYSIEGRAALKRITAFRLDVAPHASLPNGGAGHFSGDFHLMEVRARVHRADGTDTSLNLGRAAADHVRALDPWTKPTDGPWGVLDGSRESRWDISPVQTQPHWLVLIPDIPYDFGETDTLIVELDSGNEMWPLARLGHFRLSVSEDLRVDLADELIAAVRQNALPPDEMLAAACLISGEAAIALKVLEHAPQTESRDKLLRSLLLATAQRLLGQHEVAQKTVKAALSESPPDPWSHSLTGFYLRSLRDFADLSIDDVIKLRESRDAEFVSHEFELELARLTQAIEANPTDSANVETRANSLMRLGRWSDAANDWIAVRKQTPDRRGAWFTEANCRLLAGEDASYKQLCLDMVEQFRGTTDSRIADSVTKTCLLRPSTIAPSELPVQLVRDAINDPTQAGFHRWFVGSSALASYREGEFDEAITWAEKHPDNKGVHGALALVVRAMAEHQLGQHDQSQQTLAEAEALIPKSLRTLGTPDIPPQRPAPADDIASDWLTTELLRREAALLIRRDSGLNTLLK